MDVEVAAAPLGGSRRGRSVAVVVGLAALLGAILGTIEMKARKETERAQLMASQVSVDLYGRDTARQIVADAEAALGEQARAARVEAASGEDRAAATQPPDPVALTVAQSEAEAAARLEEIATSVGRVPDASSGVDAATLAAIGSTDAELEAMEARLVHQLALARTFGRRRGRAIFALSLVALAAVLAGLGAVLGPAWGGTVSVAVGAVALSLAFGAGAVSVLG